MYWNVAWLSKHNSKGDDQTIFMVHAQVPRFASTIWRLPVTWVVSIVRRFFWTIRSFILTMYSEIIEWTAIAQCWTNGVDAGPALEQRWAIVRDNLLVIRGCRGPWPDLWPRRYSSQGVGIQASAKRTSWVLLLMRPLLQCFCFCHSCRCSCFWGHSCCICCCWRLLAGDVATICPDDCWLCQLTGCDSDTPDAAVDADDAATAHFHIQTIRPLYSSSHTHACCKTPDRIPTLDQSWDNVSDVAPALNQRLTNVRWQLQQQGPQQILPPTALPSARSTGACTWSSQQTPARHVTSSTFTRITNKRDKR